MGVMPPDYMQEYIKKRVIKDSTYHRARHLRRRYSMTTDDYQRMKDEQDSKCAICKKERKLYVDHDHATKKVRGLLCTHCNSALRLIDVEELYEAALDYKRKYGHSNTLL